MNPAERMVRVLRYLAEHGGCADSTDIRRGVPAYRRDAGGRKLWQRDLKELQRRGLVASKGPGELMSLQVMLVPLRKPERLFLTIAEHDVLGEVEVRLRQDCPAPSPLPEGRVPDLADLARLTRYLEERPEQDLTYATVEQALGLERAQLTKLLTEIVEYDQVVGDSTGRHPALGWIEYRDPDEECPGGNVCNVVDLAEVLGDAVAETLNPRARTGQLGFFAYSAAETDHRLALIDRSLQELDLSMHQRRCLKSARRKLSEWRGQLLSA